MAGGAAEAGTRGRRAEQRAARHGRRVGGGHRRPGGADVARDPDGDRVLARVAAGALRGQEVRHARRGRELRARGGPLDELPRVTQVPLGVPGGPATGPLLAMVYSKIVVWSAPAPSTPPMT